MGCVIAVFRFVSIYCAVQGTISSIPYSTVSTGSTEEYTKTLSVQENIKAPCSSDCCNARAHTHTYIYTHTGAVPFTAQASHGRIVFRVEICI